MTAEPKPTAVATPGLSGGGDQLVAGKVKPTLSRGKLSSEYRITQVMIAFGFCVTVGGILIALLIPDKVELGLGLVTAGMTMASQKSSAYTGTRGGMKIGNGAASNPK
jgi:hypothetical protein